MKKSVMLLVGIVLCFTTINAQTNVNNSYTVNGQVLDSLSNETVPYATISIAFMQTPDQLVKAIACDGEGKFTVQLKDAGNYVMTVQSVGKVAVIKQFTLSETGKGINLGKIFIQENVQTIDEVTVTAQKPLIKVEIDKLVYSMEDDPESKVNNTLDMLRKVPLITVDGDDKIQFKGASNFKIYMNGKPSNLLSGQNVSDVLKSMPASSIKSIEVITDPGAKYDAEGIAGIINIITTRNALQGYSGSVSANAGTFGSFGGGVYLTAKVGKLGLTGNFNYSNYQRPWSDNESVNENFINDNYHKETTLGRSRYQGGYTFGNMEASYEIDTLNLLSFGMNLFGGNSKNTFERDITMLNRSGELMYDYDRDGDGQYDYGSMGLNLDYQRSTHKKGEYLTFSYRFYNSPDGSENTSYVDNITGTLPTHLKLGQWHENDAKTREHTAQIDYVNPITQSHSVEAGVKYIFRQNLSDVKQHEMLQGNTDWSTIPAKDNDDFDHSSHIYAGYLGYAFKTAKIGLKAGIRAEGTQQSVGYKLNRSMDFNTDYFNVVPNVSASYQITMAQQIRLGYSLRIFRPSIWYLNPYVNDIDPFNISYGNPDLDAEKSNNINLNYSYFSQKLTLNLSMTYSYVNNSIESRTFINPATPNVKERTYDNIGKNARTGLYANIGWTPITKLRINVNGGLNYTDVESTELEMSNSGLNGNVYLSGQLTLPYDFRINVNGGYYSGWIMLQGKQSAQYFSSIGVNKDFLKKKLTVSLSCSNPFNNTMTYKYSVSDQYFAMNNTNYMKARELRISLNYRFGTMKEAIKKVQRGISNDDMKGGGSEGGGGSM